MLDQVCYIVRIWRKFALGEAIHITYITSTVRPFANIILLTW